MARRFIRFDGVYVDDSQLSSEGYSSYLRFYPDGTVLQASSTASPEELNSWFRKERAERYFSMGWYEVQGCRLKFSTTSSSGTVEYFGRIDSAILELYSYSHINGHTELSHYRFVDVYFPDGTELVS